jgi:hypothetical protein
MSSVIYFSTKSFAFCCHGGRSISPIPLSVAGIRVQSSTAVPEIRFKVWHIVAQALFCGSQITFRIQGAAELDVTTSYHALNDYEVREFQIFG